MRIPDRLFQRGMRRIIRWFGIWTATVVWVLATPVRLALVWPRLSKADVIVVYREGGFGHTLHGVDAARRFYSGKRVCVLFFYSHGRHNIYADLLWTDVDLIWLPVSIRFGQKMHFSMPARWYMAAGRLLTVTLKAAMRRIVIDEDDLFISLSPKNAACSLSKSTSSNAMPKYYELLRATNHSPPRLPVSIREDIEDKIAAISPGTRRNCGIYLRSKGSGDEISSYLRSGPDVDEYIPVMDFLVAQGYRLLVVGDRALSGSVRERFGRAVLDCNDIPVKHDLYNLFVPTECDFFIAEAGGGVWLSGLNGRPTLMLNAFPFFVACPSTQLYYKSAQSLDGKRLSPRQMFEEFYIRLDDFYAGRSHFIINNNSSEEMLEAVRHFVFTLGQEDAGQFPDFIDNLPEDYWMRYTDCKISSAWLMRYLAVTN